MGSRRQKTFDTSLLGLFLLFPLAACGPGPREPRGPVRPPTRPAQALTDSDRVSRLGHLVSAGSAFDWRLAEAVRGRLRFSWTPVGGGGDVVLRVNLLPARGNGAPREIARLARRAPPRSAPPVFLDEDLALSLPAGGGRLELRLEPAGSFFLSDPRIVRPDPAAESVILVLFDTTRRDALGHYGCADPSTPNLNAIFRGAWRAERAYAPASWTIPSVAALLTGRVPAVHEGRDGTPLGILPGIETLASDFGRAGWSTAAFLANPTLNDDNGFAAGFTTFFTTPYEPSSIALPGSHTIRHVPKWIAAHRGEAVFLFLLLLDPHDPYVPPDRPRGFTPFDPDYRGPIVGDEVHRLQIGALKPPAPDGLRHLRALYHDEVRYADGELGRLWNGLDPGRRSGATLVFVSDHGEEFGEHGGWKHGPALFDEVLRVPLLIRPAAGRRLPAIPPDALVSLLDLLPTIEELAGLSRPSRPLDGMSLLRAEAWRRPALPPITMLTGGPTRAVVVRKGSKLFFFDRLARRGIPDARRDPDGHRLAAGLPKVLPALGRFDLASDPGETRLLPVDPETFAADWRSIEHAIGGAREGLELRFLGDASASALRVTVAGFPGDAAIEPFALEKEDRFFWKRTASGLSLEARLAVRSDVDGFRIQGAGQGDLEVSVSAENGCAVLVPQQTARPAAGESVRISLATIPAAPPRFEHAPACIGAFLWSSTGKRPAPTGPEADEAWRKLRSLGYIH